MQRRAVNCRALHRSLSQNLARLARWRYLHPANWRSAIRYHRGFQLPYQPEILPSNPPANYPANCLPTASNRLPTAFFQPPIPPISWKRGFRPLRWRYGCENPYDKPSLAGLLKTATRQSEKPCPRKNQRAEKLPPPNRPPSRRATKLPTGPALFPPTGAKPRWLPLLPRRLAAPFAVPFSRRRDNSTVRQQLRQFLPKLWPSRHRDGILHLMHIVQHSN